MENGWYLRNVLVHTTYLYYIIDRICIGKDYASIVGLPNFFFLRCKSTFTCTIIKVYVISYPKLNHMFAGFAWLF